MRSDVKTAFTANGLVATLTDAENNKTTYEYDGHDRLVTTFLPSGTKGAGVSSEIIYEQLSYENRTSGGVGFTSGTVASRRLRDGSSIAFSYDDLGRVVLKDLPGTDPDVAYDYDNLGRLVRADQAPLSSISGAGDIAFAYDALGRQLSESATKAIASGPVTYVVSSAWDLAGRRTRVTHPDGFFFTQEYLTTGEMAAVKEKGGIPGEVLLATYGYDDLGRRTNITRGNGTTTGYTYDPVSRLKTLSHDLGGTSSDVTTTFGYNPASQIASRASGNDAYALSGLANGSRTDTHNGHNQIATLAGTTATHDANGNLTDDGQRSYTYNSENMLTSVTEPLGGSTTVGYDAVGRMAKITTAGEVHYLYYGLDLIREYGATGNLLRRYVHGPGMDEPIVWYEGSSLTDRRWLHQDERCPPSPRPTARRNPTK